MQGSGSVSSDGAATYEVPIFCPPGTNGMQPSVSIAYNSKNSYGCLGWGWDIVGLSSISRIQKTPIQNGGWNAVQMTTADVFALDGNRLIVSSLGQGNIVYYTENASFYSITSYGSTGRGPSCFSVLLPDGSLREYGNTQDSKALISDDGTGTTGIWRINKSMDVNGNYITYQYNSAGLIEKISYTGTLSFLPYNEIDFLYASRTDNNITYRGYSASINDSYLLTEVNVKCNGSIVRKYTFTYEKIQTDVYSLLNEITETDGAGTPLNSTVFTWGDKLTAGNCFTDSELPELCNGPAEAVISNTEGIQYASKESASWTGIIFNNAGLSITGDNFFARPKPNSNPPSGSDVPWSEMKGDYNGDGWSDVFRVKNAKNADNSTKITWNLLLYDPLTNQMGSPFSGDITSGVALKDLAFMQMTSSDYDGNGVDDIFLTVWDEVKTGISIYDSVDMRSYMFNGTALTATNFGIKNLAMRGVLWSHEQMSYYISFADMDGDSKRDEIIVDNFSDNILRIYMNNLPLRSSVFDTTAPASFRIAQYEDFKIIDFNGNGVPDILRTKKNRYAMTYGIYEYTGSAFSKIHSFQIAGGNVGDSIVPGDYNGDGKTDMLMYNGISGVWNLKFSEGDHYSSTDIFSVLTNDLNTLNNIRHIGLATLMGRGKPTFS